MFCKKAQHNKRGAPLLRDVITLLLHSHRGATQLSRYAIPNVYTW